MAEAVEKLAFKGGVSNGHTPWRNTRDESLGYGIAEIANFGVSMGALYLVEQLPKAITDPITTAAGKIIEPIQVPLEKILGFFCRLEECKPDLTKTVAERAKATAHFLVMAVPPLAVSWLLKLQIRRSVNGLLKIPDSHPTNSSIFNITKWSPEEKMLLLADEGMHAATMLAAQSSMFAPTTDKFIASLSDKIKSTTGWSKQESNDFALFIGLHELPNLVGAITAIGTIAGRHHLGWPGGWIGKLFGKKDMGIGSHVEKLVLQDAAQTHLPFGA